MRQREDRMATHNVEGKISMKERESSVRSTTSEWKAGSSILVLRFCEVTSQDWLKGPTPRSLLTMCHIEHKMFSTMPSM